MSCSGDLLVTTDARDPLYTERSKEEDLSPGSLEKETDEAPLPWSSLRYCSFV